MVYDATTATRIVSPSRTFVLLKSHGPIDWGSDDGRLIDGRLGWHFLGPLALCSSFPLPLFLLLLFLGKISLTLRERVVRFGHLRSYSMGFEVETNY